MNKTIWDITEDLALQNYGLNAAISVLAEAVEYFERKMEPHSAEASYLAMRQDHILNLFWVAERMLQDVNEAQDRIIDCLWKKAKEERGVADGE
ncbi:MAG: hypothetical protein LBP30_00860 [Clostridiales Family XIII bacterium]|jgi:hypothetical protein|nr:hypothetical protein [Clostridiales Family XIII bacterium]